MTKEAIIPEPQRVVESSSTWVHQPELETRGKMRKRRRVPRESPSNPLSEERPT